MSAETQIVNTGSSASLSQRRTNAEETCVAAPSLAIASALPLPEASQTNQCLDTVLAIAKRLLFPLLATITAWQCSQSGRICLRIKSVPRRLLHVERCNSHSSETICNAICIEQRGRVAIQRVRRFEKRLHFHVQNTFLATSFTSYCCSIKRDNNERRDCL